METLNVEFPDDFEEFRARATSGGSMYGIFRRRVISNSASSKANNNNSRGSDVNTKTKHALPKPFKRQRSRSLITCSQPLVDEKSALLALFDYAEAKRHQSDGRRHSTAVDGRDLRRVALTNSISRNLNLRTSGDTSLTSAIANSNFLSPDSCLNVPTTRRSSTTIQIPNTARKCSVSLQVPSPSRKSSIALASPSRRSSILPPTESCVLTLPVPSVSTHSTSPSQPPSPPINVPRLVLNDGDNSDDIDLDTMTSRDYPYDSELQQLIVPSVQRRRSFTITQQGIKNQGDVIIQPSPTPSFLSISTEHRICTPDHVMSPPADTCADGVISLAVPSIHVAAPLTSSDVELSRFYSLDSSTEINENLQNEHLESTTCDDVIAMEMDDSATVEVPVYRVLTLGGPGVGKTALTQQFMTSEYMAAQNTSFGEV